MTMATPAVPSSGSFSSSSSYSFFPLQINSTSYPSSLSIYYNMSNGTGIFFVETEEDLIAIEESVEGFNKERLIWVLNLIVTIIIFTLDVGYIVIYYIFPRIRRSNATGTAGLEDGGYQENDGQNSDKNFPGIPNADKNSFTPKSSQPIDSTATDDSVLAFWGCPNQVCLHLTFGSLLFLIIKVTVDIFFLRISYLTRTIMIMTVVMLRLLDASLVFNSSYLFFLWLKTLFSHRTDGCGASGGVGIENRSFYISFRWILSKCRRSQPTNAVNEAGILRITWIPERVARGIVLAGNRAICITAILYGIALALIITFVFNLNGEHFLFYEFQAVKYSLLIQTLHVCANVVVWSVVIHRLSSGGGRSPITKHIRGIREISGDQEPPPQTSTTDRFGDIKSTSSAHYVEGDRHRPTPNSVPYRCQASYYFWISIGNLVAYTPFLWFYLIALMFKPNFLHDMMNMQGLIGFLGTLFDLGACVPVIVALVQDRTLRLSFVDLIYCRYGGLRKSGNLELIT